MDMSAAAEKIQRFFGLNDSDEEDYSFAQHAYVDKKETQYSSPARSTFQGNEAAENIDMRANEQAQERKQETGNKAVSQPERGTTENTRIPKKVVQMSKKESTLQKDVAGEDTVKKISILEPRTYTESKNIAKCVFRNEIVIVNFHLVEEVQARRIVDFLTGAVYALDGDIQRLGNEIFICTPPNTEIDSATAQSLLNTQFRDF